MRIEALGSLAVKAGKAAKTLHLYALSGAGFSPGYLWLDEQSRLFAFYSSWSSIIREGWEGVIPEIGKAQDARVNEREKAQAARLARRPGRLHGRPRPLRRADQGADRQERGCPELGRPLREARLRADQALQLPRSRAGAADRRTRPSARAAGERPHSERHQGGAGGA